MLNKTKLSLNNWIGAKTHWYHWQHDSSHNNFKDLKKKQKNRMRDAHCSIVYRRVYTETIDIPWVRLPFSRLFTGATLGQFRILHLSPNQKPKSEGLVMAQPYNIRIAVRHMQKALMLRKPIREKFSAPTYQTKYASEPIKASFMLLTYSCCCCLLIRTQWFTGNGNQMSYSHWAIF